MDVYTTAFTQLSTFLGVYQLTRVVLARLHNVGFINDTTTVKKRKARFPNGLPHARCLTAKLKKSWRI